jgi:hypothetical protein
LPDPGLEGFQHRTQSLAGIGQGVSALGVCDDDADFHEAPDPVGQHAAGHGVRASTPLAEAGRLLPRFPDHSQRPPLTEQIQGGHHRTPGAGTRAGPPGFDTLALLI